MQTADSIKSILEEKTFSDDHLNTLFQNFPGFVYQLEQLPDGRFRYPYASQSALKLFGIDPKELKEDGAPLLKLIHPADFDRVMVSTAKSVEENREWHEEFRMVVGDSVIWLGCYDVPRKMSDGRVVFSGYAIDITEKKILLERLKESEREFRALVESANDIIYTLNPDGVITYASPMWRDQLGYEVAEVVGRPFTDFVHPEDVEACFRFLTETVTLKKKHAGIEYRVLHKNQTIQWHMSNAAPIFDSDGVVSKYMGIARDITENKHLQHRMERQAHFDMLTELPNRQLFFERLEKLLAQSRQVESTVALMFIDLDYFKPINDKHGHAIGDMLLQQVAQRLQNCIRRDDIVGRIGGDEFVAALMDQNHSDGTLNSALQTAHRMIAAIAKPFMIETTAHQISCSIGIALYPQDADDIITLARRADEAMYRAKRNGRGRVELFNDTVQIQTK